MAEITLDFPKIEQSSIQVGDTAYYINPDDNSGGFQVANQDNLLMKVLNQNGVFNDAKVTTIEDNNGDLKDFVVNQDKIFYIHNPFLHFV